ncbi:hypothetical protein FC093_17115 [Ilyomonas limi]|uniref:DUF6799 domain-containing protein n=1 Tax=Ilyomonas limi TaxID=2575867 RepID=A0A4U3KUS6_9BACT|nr:DUF6799 domain-containing protein [Ilyomonas limi]TKK66305.1 hypothetical protein FC093_17115 [Ilyomonas limi]
MKKLLTLIIALTICIVVIAQADRLNKKTESKTEQTDHSTDHIMMMSGKMMIIKSGKSTMMDKDIKLGDGTVVMRDGKVKTKDGKVMRMKDGDMIYMNGKMGKM